MVGSRFQRFESGHRLFFNQDPNIRSQAHGNHFAGAPYHRASQLPVQQRLVLFILSILSIHVP